MPDTALANSGPVTAADEARILKIAVLAVGGQGGGVLANWITAVAEQNGYLAQSTSVAGVAQRTGATIYYIEMCPDTGRLPVFALAPAPGDVDILIASELMEAGRAVMRGFVTPDRTTLIASTHRIAAVSEKIVPGDGQAPAADVQAKAESAALRSVCFDMEQMAVEAGSVVSASLFGALAGSGVLPFARDSFEATVRASDRGAEASLRAFDLAFRAAKGEVDAKPPADTGKAPDLAAASGPSGKLRQWQALTRRVSDLPEPVREMAMRGLRKVVDFQDAAYGGLYLDRLDAALARDAADRGYRLTLAAAKHVANAMCYDDMIRVADLKTRAARGTRIRGEMAVDDAKVLQLTEFFHPRVEEFTSVMPARLGRYIEARPRLSAWIDRRINRGRRIRTDRITGFGSLWLIAGLKRWRRRLLRHKVETEHFDRWFDMALATADEDYALAVEILNCRRLIKGYSDTHARAQSKFDRVISGVELVRGRADAAEWIMRLREAALKDENGSMLDGALATIRTLDEPVHPA